ncbi:unnamed protein product [Rotaria sp. Silwood2]|nr:unnamed protein product [Rotaria sp. Silwood2]CAF2467481.1 unnamed protein product [Rotaria sp. Silwood2]CAF2703525.1 unnamed protein product [Rotaria sp. Silwood2]CAF3895156.1 unnamed protein product [Rotaria sp. Silwood2]CAF4002743.1 unnamed protein product [Rotaria sp. Silwood2]
MQNAGGDDDLLEWYPSQVKGPVDDEVQEADLISTIEFNENGELLAVGDKGGRIVIFQREQQTKTSPRRHEYNVYITFHSHEPEFDYLKSLEIEEKINQIRWLKRKNPAHFLLSTNGNSNLKNFRYNYKTVKLWKISEKTKRAEGFNLRDDNGIIRSTDSITNLRIPVIKPMELMVEATPKRVFSNAHTYHINSISLNSDQETFLSADDLRINLWHAEVTNQSFNIVDIKPPNMEDLTEVITGAEFHPRECNLFVYSSSRGIIRLCDMRQSALCDRHCKVFEEPEDPTTRSFFSEIISSISDIKFSHSGRYMLTRDFLNLKVWDLQMDNRPVETYPIHEYLRTKLCALYENDCIFDKFECCWSPRDNHLLTGSYHNLFKITSRVTRKDAIFESSREQAIRPRQLLKAKKVTPSARRNRRDEINSDSLEFSKKILHCAYHPTDNIIAIATAHNLFTYVAKDSSSLSS